jgi:hypothetical protein
MTDEKSNNSGWRPKGFTYPPNMPIGEKKFYNDLLGNDDPNNPKTPNGIAAWSHVDQMNKLFERELEQDMKNSAKNRLLLTMVGLITICSCCGGLALLLK